MPVFSNQATLSYNNNTVNSNVVTGEIVEVLSATKTSLTDNYTPGGSVTYIINIANTGTAPFTGLTVTDDLGTYNLANGTAVVPLDYVDGSVRYFVNGDLQATPAVNTASGLAVSGITVPAGGNAQILYQTTVNNFAPLTTGSVINNTASITGAGLTNPVTADETIAINTYPILSIVKAVSPNTVSENGILNYTFTIQNTGNTEADAGDNIVVRDTFNPILNPITVTLDGTTLTEGTDYTYDTETGLFTTTAGRITVPAAVYTQNPTTGENTVTPGTTVLTVSGTV
ncbi:MAG: hypothetical protein NC320_07120 [Clostridium sp.]|nr:hypothetical protein [Clostridium sp.]MCM1547441.1 hypothetical protein [Ruminococcus sp.]